jgi:hypothetical protein
MCTFLNASHVGKLWIICELLFSLRRKTRFKLYMIRGKSLRPRFSGPSLLFQVKTRDQAPVTPHYIATAPLKMQFLRGILFCSPIIGLGAMALKDVSSTYENLRKNRIDAPHDNASVCWEIVKDRGRLAQSMEEWLTHILL